MSAAPSLLETMTRPDVINPPKGRRPVSANCRLDELQVDPAYQRDLPRESITLIRAMARDWDWSLCQPLVVARRADDSLWVVDGQHRRAAAELRGDILDLPCIIVDLGGQASEARTFVALNTARRALTPFAIWKAAIAAGDAAAIALQDILHRNGLRVAASNNKAHWRPGEIGVINQLQRIQARHGDAMLDRALRVLVAAFGDAPLIAGPSLLIGLMPRLAATTGHDDTDLVATLHAKSQDQWMRAIAIRVADTGVGYHACAIAIVGDASPTLPPPRSVEAPPAPAAPTERKKPRNFEEQLAAVKRGVPLVDNRPIRKPDPEGTQGGVGSGMD